jgi:hypothetical protein
MAYKDVPPEVIGRQVFLWTFACALAFALAAFILTS